MRLDRFDAPGFLEDFNNEQKVAWSEWISGQLDRAAHGRPDVYDFDGPREQFYNPIRVQAGDDAKEVDISWTAFPRNVQVNSVGDVQRWRRADASRDVQDEYCEWSIERDPTTDKITRVTFTCEGPEYWQFLATTTPEVALELYRRFVNAEVMMDDLFDSNGNYLLRNKWNSSTINGAMHLVQAANTLGAEIELAAGSSVVRVIGGQMLTGEQELIVCGGYGDEKRNSDPHIGGVINSVTRQKADVTLANPIGLYFHDLLTGGWATPDGSDPKSYWNYVRGTAEKPVRAVYEVPADKNFVVGDITIGGRTIDYAAQIADYITIKLTGVATRFGQSTVAPMTSCRRRKQSGGAALTAAAPTPLSVADALEPRYSGTR